MTRELTEKRTFRDEITHYSDRGSSPESIEFSFLRDSLAENERMRTTRAALWNEAARRAGLGGYFRVRMSPLPEPPAEWMALFIDGHAAACLVRALFDVYAATAVLHSWDKFIGSLGLLFRFC